MDYELGEGRSHPPHRPQDIQRRAESDLARRSRPENSVLKYEFLISNVFALNAAPGPYGRRLNRVRNPRNETTVLNRSLPSNQMV